MLGHVSSVRAMVAVTVVVALASGCSPAERRTDAAAGVRSASSRVPDATLTDWVSYGDALAVVEVRSEVRHPIGDEVIESGEGLIGRTVTAQAVEVSWTRVGAPPLPEPLSLETSGWHYKRGEVSTFAIHGEPRLEVGSTYAVLLTLFPEGWGALATIPMTEERVLVPDRSNAKPWARQVTGMSVASLSRSLRSVEPDPEAAKRFDLDPESRWLAVQATE